jgi:hypothetical protein
MLYESFAAIMTCAMPWESVQQCGANAAFVAVFLAASD